MNGVCEHRVSPCAICISGRKFSDSKSNVTLVCPTVVGVCEHKLFVDRCQICVLQQFHKRKIVKQEVKRVSKRVYFKCHECKTKLVRVYGARCRICEIEFNRTREESSSDTEEESDFVGSSDSETDEPKQIPKPKSKLLSSR